VREIDADAQAAVQWFLVTHQRGVDGWLRVGYPRAGGVEDQEARLLESVEAARQAANAVIREQTMTQPTDTPARHG